MDKATQIALAKRVFAHLEAKTTDLADDIMINPVAAYSSPERLALEKQKLFLALPLLMTMSCHIPENGDFVTDDSTDVPILIVRGDDGKVRAFVNACRHRGARLVEDVGQVRKALTCPYHAWSYDTQGKFMHAPSKEYFEGLDFADCNLRQLACTERDGMIWVRAGGNEAIDIDAHLDGLAPEFASYGFDAYHHYESREIHCQMNWKAIIDTFLEPYHLAVLHKNTVASLLYGNLCLMDTFGPNLRETLPRRSIVELEGQPEKDWDLIDHTALVYVLFPNTVFVMQRDHAEVWRSFPVDNDPSKCRVFLEFYIPEPALTEKARRHWDKNMDLTIRTVLDEDFPVSEGAQRGYVAGAQESIVYGKNEPALIHFQRSIAAALG